MKTPDQITLHIGGREFKKEWDEVRVSKSLNSLCASFEFVTTQDIPFNPINWAIQMGAECSIYVSNDTRSDLVTTGYIEDINIDYDKGSHTVHVAGRDKTADLVDCCVTGTQNQWTNSRALSIIQTIVKPFNIPVVVDASAVTAMNQVVTPRGAQAGDPVFELIMKVSKLVGMIPMATIDGKLLITATGTTASADSIQSGVNVLKGSLKQSNKERFSLYFCKGYDYVTDMKLPKNFSWAFAKATDPLIARYRPISFTMEGQGAFEAGGSRAHWEAAFRAGNSRLYGYTVQGWRQVMAPNDLWALNTTVQLSDDKFGIPNSKLDLPAIMLINAVEFIQSTSQGSLTSLQLCSPEKYKAQAALDMVKAMSDGLQIVKKP